MLMMQGRAFMHSPSPPHPGAAVAYSHAICMAGIRLSDLFLVGRKTLTWVNEHACASHRIGERTGAISGQPGRALQPEE